MHICPSTHTQAQILWQFFLKETHIHSLICLSWMHFSTLLTLISKLSLNSNSNLSQGWQHTQHWSRQIAASSKPTQAKLHSKILYLKRNSERVCIGWLWSLECRQALLRTKFSSLIYFRVVNTCDGNARLFFFSLHYENLIDLWAYKNMGLFLWLAVRTGDFKSQNVCHELPATGQF